ncbi:MAG: sigma 54 modulation/S30EA ribosomal C-terminal domain-containing protein [Actinomycetes bacterium]
MQVVGDDTPGIAEYAEERLRDVFQDTDLPIMHARFRITRHANPARERPVVAQANLDVNGRFVRAELRARTAREAVDRLRDRLRRRVQNVLGRADAMRDSQGLEAWQADELEALPAQERRIARHKKVTPMRQTVDEAEAFLEDMDYQFHLFIEASTEQDSVLYRSEPTGYRLAQVELPSDVRPPQHDVSVTVSDHPAPRLSVRQAVERMGVWTQPFLFFRNTENDRAAVLYLRHDGHYGLITPTEPSQGA